MIDTPTVAGQIMDLLETMLTDTRDPQDMSQGDLPLQPPIERDRVLKLSGATLDSRILNWGPDTTRIQEPGRPPSRRGDPEDRRTLVAMLALRCKATTNKRATEVADLGVAFAVQAVCGPVLEGSALYGLADRVYLGMREPHLGEGNPPTCAVILELHVDYWNLVNDAQRAT